MLNKLAFHTVSIMATSHDGGWTGAAAAAAVVSVFAPEFRSFHCPPVRRVHQPLAQILASCFLPQRELVVVLAR